MDAFGNKLMVGSIVVYIHTSLRGSSGYRKAGLRKGTLKRLTPKCAVIEVPGGLVTVRQDLVVQGSF